MKCLAMLLLLFLAVSLFSLNPYFTEENVNRFIAELEENGFVVQQGVVYTWDLLDLFSKHLIPSCYGNNASNPYLAYFLPPAPGQTVPNTLPFTFRLREDEAIIFIGWTPPEVTYFSYVTFVMSKYLPGQSSRQRVLASVGDTINMTRIKTGESILPETAGTVFNAPTMIISTPDKNVDILMRAAAAKVGFIQSLINTEPIPSNMLKLGLEKDCDELLSVIRLALFKNPEDVAYAQDPPLIVDGKLTVKPPYSPNYRGWVLRVTPTEPIEPDPFPTPSMIPRDTGDYSELDLKPTMDRLEEAIIKEYSNLKADVLRTQRAVEISYMAIQNVTDVLGDSRDTVYLFTDPFLLGEDPDDFAIVFGPVHSLTGKSTYSNFTIYTDDLVKDLLPVESKILYGFASVHSEHSVESKLGLIGSAERFLPDDPNAKYFYVWKVARSNPNNEDYCLLIPEPTSERVTYDILRIAFRAYVNPKTGVGPSYEEILMDKVIHFSPDK